MERACSGVFHIGAGGIPKFQNAHVIFSDWNIKCGQKCTILSFLSFFFFLICGVLFIYLFFSRFLV
jgi:hypothetical protein